MNDKYKFEIISSEELKDLKVYPTGTIKLVFRSSFDGKTDWALFLPGDTTKNTIVNMHGSFSHADQIFTRQDMRNFWLKRIIAGKHPLLSINMRDTSYMSPAATHDLSDLLDYCRNKFKCNKIILHGGSGGASSSMAYACLHPEKINGVIAMGMCDIIARLDFARKSKNEVLQMLAKVTSESYGGSPDEKPELYRNRSVLANIDKLSMPIVLTIGESDSLIPVSETRKIAEAMKNKKKFTYYEIPKGNHDSAVWVDIDLETLEVKGYFPDDRLKPF
ncbi:MAG: prolyl oligopeptidase family serine peptidase [Victivallaceae bacterium]|jgi:pimeloyl-ACP methyl ester carboxylesterase